MLKNLLVALALPFCAQAQLLTSEVILADKTGNVELRKITYKSDDLVVNGYLAMPKGDRYVRDRKPWPSLEPHGD